ncbi:MAG: alkaline phosphatase family protein [Ramlibacter sp.]|nr:alkaline phosphatase family protein [Ramlibacter sp.]
MRSARPISVLFAALVSLLLAGCTGMPAGQDRPRLVVFMVVDGLPQRQVLAYRDQLAPDGLARFLDRGAWFAEAHYGHAVTATAPGHASMLTGAYPHRTGIIHNEWRDVNTGDPVYNTGDTAASYIGHKTRPLDGTSPRNLKAETVGDVLRRIEPRSRVIAISGKDRGAILPAGRSGVAYMYMGESGQFASSTHYMKEHPAWVTAFHARKTADRYFKTEWKPLLPEAAYARSIPDNQPWFGPRGGKLPMMMGVAADDAPGPAYYGALLASPFADILALEFARAAIAGEQLGRDDAPDILVVSLSGHDYVNHRWSAESRLSHDHLLQLDRQFEVFFRDLDTAVGRDNYLALLTADHGFMPAPEHSQAQGQAGGRLSSGQMLTRVNADLQRAFGEAKLVPFISASTALVLDRKLIAQKGLDFDAIALAARASLLAEPAVAAAYTRRELESGSRAGAPFFEAMRRSWHQQISGDVQFVYKPLWMAASSSGYAATHGSPHRYDTHVPIMLWGPKWVRAGRVDARVEVADIAPTLSRLLRVPAPAASEGRPLPLPAP